MTAKLHGIYEGLTKYMSACLGVNRNVVDHPGAKGTGAELKWGEFFDQHLPHRYRAANGFVVDRRGEVSEQIDLIVYDRQYTPHLYNLNGQTFVPAESVYATLEVKQKIDKGMIEYAGQKAASVRRLERTSATITHAGGAFTPRPPFRIPAGILALESNWNPPFGDAFVGVVSSSPEVERVDFGCAVASGAFTVTYAPVAPPTVAVSSPEHSLVYFLFSMLQRLQGLGTVPAIDYEKYLTTVTMR